MIASWCAPYASVRQTLSSDACGYGAPDSMASVPSRSASATDVSMARCACLVSMQDTSLPVYNGFMSLDCGVIHAPPLAAAPRTAAKNSLGTAVTNLGHT